MSPHGCNQPHTHTGVTALDPSKWGKKIPLIDLSITLQGENLNPGFGINKWQDLCKRTKDLLSAGIDAKSGWVVENPRSDLHALACTSRFYGAVINFINAVNDIPNNAPQPSKVPISGPDDEGVGKVLEDEPEPEDVGAVAMYKAMLQIDHVAAPEEPILDTN